MIELLCILVLLTGCGQVNVKGGTKNEVVTTGKTTVEIVLKVDPSLCNGQENQAECLSNLTTLLQEFLKTLQQTKELQP
jgi:hypothetical protein